MSGPRSELGAALRANAPPGLHVYDEPPRQLTPPALVIKPGVPYRRPSPGCTDDLWRLDVWCIVGRDIGTPADSLDSMASLVAGTVAALREASWLGVSGSLIHEDVSGIAVLASVAEVSWRT